MTANDSKIKIMHVISRMNVGGPAVMIVDSIRMLDAHKFEQKLFAGECEPGEADYLQTQAQDIDAIFVKGLGRKIDIKGDLQALVSIMREIKKYKPDIIHTHASKAGLLGRAAAILARSDVKLVHTFHGHILSGYFGRFKSHVFIFIERILARYSDVLIAVGKKVKMDLLAAKIGQHEQFVVIYPGVKPPKQYTKQFAREKLGLDYPEGQLVCAFFGRITNIKRPDRFLEVVRISQENSFPISFFIAGEGDLSNAMKDEIDVSNLPIKWLGWQNDVGLVISALDFLLICSDNEGLPLSAIEAGYLSKVVISTDVGSIAEVISDGVTGFITEKDSNDIIKSIEYLLKVNSNFEKIGAAAKNKIEKEFTLTIFLDEISRLYTRVAPPRF